VASNVAKLAEIQVLCKNEHGKRNAEVKIFRVNYNYDRFCARLVED